MGNEQIYAGGNKLQEIFTKEKPIIPTLHLLSLPGSPFYDGRPMDDIIAYTLDEVEDLIECGVDGFIVENHGDIPFVKPEQFPYETVAAMAVVGREVSKMVKKHGLGLGVNCLANAAIPALSIAKAIEADFVRINQYANAYVANEGFVEGLAGAVLRYRKNIGADSVAIFADVHVKHGSHAIVADRPIEEQAKDVLFFAGDVLVCTGSRTGDAPSDEEMCAIKIKPEVPIVVGSGIDMDNLERIFKIADGGIIASYFKKDGVWYNKVEKDRAMRFMDKMRTLRARG